MATLITKQVTCAAAECKAPKIITNGASCGYVHRIAVRLAQ